MQYFLKQVLLYKFMIEDDDFLEKNNTIWDQVSADIRICWRACI